MNLQMSFSNLCIIGQYLYSSHLRVLFIYVYIYLRLLNDAVSSSVWKASNCRMVNEYWIKKDMEGNSRGVI
jgi:hypothetical protein